MQKKYTSQRKVKRILLYSLLVTVVFIKAACVLDFNYVGTPPSSANANTDFTVTLLAKLTNGGLGAVDGKRLVFAVLVPKSWKGRLNDNIRVKYKADIGGGTMRLIPDNVTIESQPYAVTLKSFHGVSGNLIDDHEWVAFMSDEGYSVNTGQKIDATITATIKTGPDKMRTKLGYIVSFNGENTNGVDTYKEIQSSCFEVLTGTGDGVDFCNKPLSSITPLSGTDNDYFKLVYDNDLLPSPVTGASELYLHIDTAHCTNGETLRRTISDNASKLNAKPQQIFSKTFWLRGFLNLKDTQHLDYIKYYIVDGQGHKAGLSGSASTPLVFRIKCD